MQAKLVDKMKKRPYLSVILHVKDIENITWPRRAGGYKISPRVLKIKFLFPRPFFQREYQFPLLSEQ